MAKLIIETPDGENIIHELTEPVVIGRSPTATLQVLDRKLSREHCKFTKRLGAWQVEDLGSSNGTRVNDAACTKRMLEHGDRIGVGHTKIRYEIEQAKIDVPTLKRRDSVRDRLAKKRRK